MNTSTDRTGGGAERGSASHWPEIARHWRQTGPPLRPVAEDIGFCADAVGEWVRHRGAPRVLLLGVTPELYRLPWPKGTDFLAADRTRAMIDTVWPGPKEAAQCTDWLALALPDGSRDVVLCDGGMHLIAYPEGQRRLVRLLRRVLSDQGLCVLRLYAPPRQRESPDAVLKDLLEGRIRNLNVLKLRLGMSLMDGAEGGVEVGAVWRAIHEVAPDLEGLASRIGWPVEHMLAINAYRGSTDRYYFVTVEQVCDLFCRSPGGFEVQSLHVPLYQMGEQCPTIVLRRVKGCLSMTLLCRELGLDGIIVPEENAEEAGVVQGIEVIPLKSLTEVVGYLTDNVVMESYRVDLEEALSRNSAYDVDFSEVKGQEHAKRALTVAAAGGHNVLMIGPPGAGKSMLAQRLPTILPPMTLEEALETTKVYSVDGRLGATQALIGTRPFRSPHHTVSDIGLVGGGTTPRPGEVSLAHHGILFLDELPQFERKTLEVLRQPMEDGRVTISRAKMTVTYPSQFMFVAALNP